MDKKSILTDQDHSIDSKTKPYKKRPPVFVCPALPKWETRYYLGFGVALFSYAWFRVYQASMQYEWDGWYGLYDTKNLPFLGEWKKDVTNFEWSKWKPYAWDMLPWLIGHSLLFNLSEKVLPHNVWRIVTFLYWVLADIVVFDYILVLAAFVSGLLVYCLMRSTKSKLGIWLVSLAILYFSLNHVDYFHKPKCYYIGVMFLSYKMLQFISFNVEECGVGRLENKSFFQGLCNMFWYAFYLPYSTSLIVIYKRFPDELAARKSKQRDLRSTILFGLRMVFWYLFIEHVFLYFMYFEALMTDRDFLSSTTEDTLVSVAYATGQFFQMKYAVIFGVPAFFAKIDNMSPLRGPICIARVSMYSKIWRNFDRGLYEFFKEYIFLPICRPSFSLIRVILGVFVSYGFVLVWHGLTHQYIVWIILNITELFVEQIAKRIYSLEPVKNWCTKTFRPNAFRRILAVLQIFPLAMGLYAIFYFLADSQSGYIIVERIFWEETVNLRWPFFMLLFIGYNYNQMCMDVERWQNEQEEKTKTNGENGDEKKGKLKTK